jgi:hypothetical protein
MVARVLSEREHRRGLVLGLTLAEIMLLLLFLLLLALGNALRKEKAFLEIEREKVARREKELEDARAWERVLKDNGEESWITVAKRNAQLEKENTQLKERNTELRRVATDQQSEIDKLEPARAIATRINPADPPAVLQRSAELMEKIGADFANDILDHPEKASTLVQLRPLLERAEKINPDDPAVALRRAVELAEHLGPQLTGAGSEKIKELASNITNAEAVNAQREEKLKQVELQLENLKRRGGNDYPSCWIASDGSTEYMFSITIRDGGILFQDAAPPYRRLHEAAALMTGVPRSVELTEKLFRQYAEPIRSWSEERECRFFVKMKDETAMRSKEVYKRLRRLVENHFYIKLI